MSARRESATGRIDRGDIDRLLADRFGRDAIEQSNFAWCRANGISERTLRRVGEVLRRAHRTGESAAVAGFRFGCEAARAVAESGRIARDFGLNDRAWCRRHRVAPAAIERVAETYGTYPEPFVAAIYGFQLGHEAASPVGASA